MGPATRTPLQDREYVRVKLEWVLISSTIIVRPGLGWPVGPATSSGQRDPGGSRCPVRSSGGFFGSSILESLEPVSSTAHRGYVRWVAWRVELLTKISNIHVHKVAARIEVISPNRREQLASREYLASMSNEALQHRILPIREIDHDPCPADTSGNQINAKLADNVGGVPLGFGTPHERFDSRQKFFEREGFGQVLVGPQLEC